MADRLGSVVALSPDTNTDTEGAMCNTEGVTSHTESVIRTELSELTKRLPSQDGFSVITCDRRMVQVCVHCTEFKQITLMFQFPELDYPLSPVLIELKSRSICPSLLKGLQAKCEEEASRYIGQVHIHKVCYFIRTFLRENPLSACADELSFIKSQLIDPDTDSLRQRLRAGVILITLKRGSYCLEAKLSIPDSYPVEPVSVLLRNSNIPAHLCKLFNAQATELARRCVETPLLKKKKEKNVNFQPNPSLRPVAEFLIEKCFKKCLSDKCPICTQPSLPPAPALPLGQGDPLYPVRVLCCSHLYHFSCLDRYVKSPPFDDRKKCLRCGEGVYNECWKDSPHLTEEKWAYREAKNREIEDVADFFS